jgi:hypothetical protein
VISTRKRAWEQRQTRGKKFKPEKIFETDSQNFRLDPVRSLARLRLQGVQVGRAHRTDADSAWAAVFEGESARTATVPLKEKRKGTGLAKEQQRDQTDSRMQVGDWRACSE